MPDHEEAVREAHGGMAYYAVRGLLGWVNPKGWRRDAVEDLRVYREHIRAQERARYAALVEVVRTHLYGLHPDVDAALAALQEGTNE